MDVRRCLIEIHIALRNIYKGFRNLWVWLPVVWRDRDWGWQFLAEIMTLKLLLMSAYFEKYGYVLHSERYAKQTAICAFLLKRLADDDYWQMKKFGSVISWKQQNAIKKADIELCFKIMSKHLQEWWD